MKLYFTSIEEIGVTRTDCKCDNASMLNHRFIAKIAGSRFFAKFVEGNNICCNLQNHEGVNFKDVFIEIMKSVPTGTDSVSCKL